MQMPDEDEYGEILARIGGAMIYSCQELELLIDGVRAGISQPDADEVSSRMRNLAKILERIGTNVADPAPLDLPTPNMQLHAVGVDRQS